VLIEDVEEQVRTMHRVSKILEQTNFDTYASVMQAEFNCAFNKSTDKGEINEILCGYIMRSQSRTAYEQVWFVPLLEAVQREIIARKQSVVNITGFGPRGLRTGLKGRWSTRQRTLTSQRGRQWCMGTRGQLVSVVATVLRHVS
jgi:hypothetical protein